MQFFYHGFAPASFFFPFSFRRDSLERYKWHIEFVSARRRICDEMNSFLAAAVAALDHAVKLVECNVQCTSLTYARRSHDGLYRSLTFTGFEVGRSLP